MSDNNDHLTPTMRKAIQQGEEYSRVINDETMSPTQLRATLRKQRIDNLILQKKLAAAERKIEQLKASQALAEALTTDEPTCP